MTTDFFRTSELILVLNPAEQSVSCWASETLNCACGFVGAGYGLRVGSAGTLLIMWTCSVGVRGKNSIYAAARFIHVVRWDVRSRDDGTSPRPFPDGEGEGKDPSGPDSSSCLRVSVQFSWS